jgi:hypothetical protein
MNDLGIMMIRTLNVKYVKEEESRFELKLLILKDLLIVKTGFKLLE